MMTELCPFFDFAIHLAQFDKNEDHFPFTIVTIALLHFQFFLIASHKKSWSSI